MARNKRSLVIQAFLILTGLLVSAGPAQAVTKQPSPAQLTDVSHCDLAALEVDEVIWEILDIPGHIVPPLPDYTIGYLLNEAAPWATCMAFWVGGDVWRVSCERLVASGVPPEVFNCELDH